jgi:hypothetical protein
VKGLLVKLDALGFVEFGWFMKMVGEIFHLLMMGLRQKVKKS